MIKKVLAGLLIFSAVVCCNAFVFTNYTTIQLDTAPATGVNPVSGFIYQWWTKSGSVLTLNWRDSTGVNYTFSGSGGSGLTSVAVDGTTITGDGTTGNPLVSHSSGGVSLGETSTTAYRGDRGKTAYDHSQSTGNPHGTAADVDAEPTLGNPTTDDYILSSKANGTRSWIAPPTGGGESIGTIVSITTSGTWTVPAGVTLLKDVWIIAGGGGGGGGVSRDGGGGGAGGVKHIQNIYVTPADGLVAVIGAGGAGGVSSADGSVGGASSIVINTITYSTTGGGGGEGFGHTLGSGSNGGSGGGGASGANGGTGIAATLGQVDIIQGQGYRGMGGDWSAGGGGGYSVAGSSGTSSTGGGVGGDGLDLRVFVGTSIGDSGWFAGGGAGGNHTTGKRVASGGKGGGGAAGITTGGAGVAGTDNTGGGGGGATNYIGNGGAGGSGIIIIRY